MDDFIVGPQCEEMGLIEEVHNMVDEMWDAVAAGKEYATSIVSIQSGLKGVRE